MNAPQETRREWLVLMVLSGIQFSQMVDFMVLMPLGTQLMREFGITPTQLGFSSRSTRWRPAFRAFSRHSSSTASTAGPRCSRCTPASR